MADTIDGLTTMPFQGAGIQGTEKGVVTRTWERVALAVILLLSIFMNFFQLGQGSYGNLYYAAGIRSMIDSLHNFFFVSYDPGGFVTIDKPPLGFWLQALSAKIFGFTPFSIFLPQALCGVLAVLLLYFLVRRHFGVVAGLVAALALAVSPISVVTNRNNTIDSTLALALLLAAWAVIRAAESGKLRWLLLSAVFVGLGFNIKMSEAYLALPALSMTYLFCSPRSWLTRIWHLALFAVVCLMLSLSWAAMVDLTPASQRPYVGSTQNNSELSLAFGYNGLNRLHIGGNNFGGRGTRNTRSFNSSNTNGTNSSNSNGTTGRTGSARYGSNGSSQNGAAPGSGSGNGGGYGNAPRQNGGGAGFQGGGNFAGGFATGTPGALRLFSPSLGGQIGWLLPFALLGVLALLWQRRFNFQRDRQQLGLVLWGLWLLTMTAFFTLDGSFHQYYMTELAPGLSAMVGIGLVIMWRDYRTPGWRGWLLPLALLITAGAQIYMLASFPSWSVWLSPVIGILAGLAILVLIVLRLQPQLRLAEIPASVGATAISIGILALLLAPTIWSGYSVIQNTESSAPTAGPTMQADNNAGGGIASRNGGTGTRSTRANGEQNALAGLAAAFGFGGNESLQTNKALVSYLEAHQGNTKFLVATTSSSSASPIIITTNKAVMSMGGFGGGDPILTVSQLQTLIQNGTIRYFVLTSPRATQDIIDQLPEQFRNFAGGGGRGGFGFSQQNSAVTSWITSHCQTVPASEIQSTGGRNSLGNNQLYDCAPGNP